MYLSHLCISRGWVCRVHRVVGMRSLVAGMAGANAGGCGTAGDAAGAARWNKTASKQLLSWFMLEVICWRVSIT